MAATENTLLERARRYEAQALAEIYDGHAPAIYRYLYRFLGDAPLAEDLTGDVFLKLLQVLGTSRAPRDNLQGWLYRVARNLAMDCFRREARGATLPLDEEMTAGSDSPLARLERYQLGRQVRHALAQLTADQQQVILLRFGEGLPIEEVGRLLGKSQGAIKLLQHRAVKRLQRLLEREEFRIDGTESRGSVRGIAAG